MGVDDRMQDIMVRTRIAPSPTGQDFHIGNAYTALINYIFSRQKNGKFIVRIEDTDRIRLVKGSEERILNSLEWLGLVPYEGPYRQSERIKLYQKYAQVLIDKGKAYYCFCSPERLAEIRKKQQESGKVPMYDELCKKTIRRPEDKNQKHVIRLNVPDKEETSFNDLVRGKVTFQNALIDDQILLKSDGFPTYHLAVVIDDYLMKISHVIRAEEWLSSTPKHVLLYKAFGWELPQFAHTPILRNPDKSKLSKRKNPVWLSWFKTQGYLPEALNNYLLTLGWSHPDDKTIFTLSEAIEKFTFERISKTGPIFDLVKLTWMNGEYVRLMSNEQLTDKMYTFLNNKYDRKLLLLLSPILKQRIKKLSDVEPLIDFFITQPKVDKKLLIPKKRNEEETKQVLENVLKSFAEIREWDAKTLHELGNKLVIKTGWKPIELFQMIRVAISGKTITPPLFESMEILGRKKTLERLNKASVQSSGDQPQQLSQ